MKPKEVIAKGNEAVELAETDTTVKLNKYSGPPRCAPAPCSASPHPTGNHVARVMEYHRSGGVWIHATCVACNLQWKERYRFDFAYETVSPNASDQATEGAAIRPDEAKELSTQA